MSEAISNRADVRFPPIADTGRTVESRTVKPSSILALAFCSLLSPPAGAQLWGKQVSGCVTTGSFVTASGQLTERHFAGPPNYQSIEAGDADELTFILMLPRHICIYDADFHTSNNPFRRVQVWTSDALLRTKLHRLLGRRVSVSGEARVEMTAHDHAPLIIEAQSASSL